jgi:molybdate transport system regulatory protein
MSDPRPASKIWLETDEGHVFGPGVYNLLKAVKEKGTLKEASESLDMSYRYAWGLIKKAEEKLDAKLIEASKGGRQGGGSSKITELGEHFIADFERIQLAWRDFRAQYDDQLQVTGEVVEVGGEVAIRIDQLVYPPSDMELTEGETVKLRLLVAKTA